MGLADDLHRRDSPAAEMRVVERHRPERARQRDPAKRGPLPRLPAEQGDPGRLPGQLVPVHRTGDDENTRRTKKQRTAATFVAAAEDEFRGNPEDDDQGPDKDGDTVDKWLNELRPDAEYNVGSYIDCFLSENLLRNYVRLKSPALAKGVTDEIVDWRKRELDGKVEANLSFDIRRNDDDLSYLGMDALAVSAEGSDAKNKKQSLWKDAISYKPIRNAVGHTGVLSDVAKRHLNLTFENIKARVKGLLKDSEPT